LGSTTSTRAVVEGWLCIGGAGLLRGIPGPPLFGSPSGRPLALFAQSGRAFGVGSPFPGSLFPTVDFCDSWAAVQAELPRPQALSLL
jgi:hypothetical protein